MASNVDNTNSEGKFFIRTDSRGILFSRTAMSVVALPLAISQCQAERCGRHDPAAEDIRGCNCREFTEEVHG